MTGSLRAGAASADITPAEPLPLAGYGARDGSAADVHDPLCAKAVVLSDEDRTVGIVSVDLLNVSRKLSATVEDVLETRGIPLDWLTVAATHTHAAPYVPTPALEVHPNLAREYDAATYVGSVADACVDAITAADEALAPATVRVGTAENGDVVENRRANPEWGARIPRGSVDPELTALSVRPERSGEVVIYNYALHPVCTTPAENKISADWPGYAADRVRERRDAVDDVLFLNGAAGDVNPRNKMAVSRTDGEVYEYMADVGHEVGDTVLAALEDADTQEPVGAGRIHVDDRHLRLRVKDPGPPAALYESIERLDARRERLRASGEEAMADHLAAERSYLVEQLAIAEWDVADLPATLKYLSFGPVGFLTAPAEVLVGHGRAWKAAASVEHLLPVSYADDYIGYLPELTDLENGGYEVETSKVHPEELCRLRKAGVKLVSQGA